MSIVSPDELGRLVKAFLGPEAELVRLAVNGNHPCITQVETSALIGA